jgi:hypothetical protein
MDPSIVRVRDLHREIDESVCEAYRWPGLNYRHGHYETPQGVRWTVHPDVRAELMDLLLELNEEFFHAEAAVEPPSVRRRRGAARRVPDGTSPAGQLPLESLE